MLVPHLCNKVLAYVPQRVAQNCGRDHYLNWEWVESASKFRVGASVCLVIQGYGQVCAS